MCRLSLLVQVFISCLVLCGFLSPVTLASEAMGWRGNGSGYYPDAVLPVSWDVKTGNNIRWSRSDLPARGTASIIGTRDRILVLCEPDQILCLRRRDGSQIWSSSLSLIDLLQQPDKETLRSMFHAAWLDYQGGDPYQGLSKASVSGPKLNRDQRHALRSRKKARWQEIHRLTGIKKPDWRETGYWGTTPASDGHTIICRHGTDVLAAYNWDGDRLWLARPNGFPLEKLGYGGQIWMLPSPIVLDDQVIVTWNPPATATKVPIQAYESLVAFDLKTGQERWRSQELARTAGWLCANPCVIRVDGKPFIVTGGGSVFDPKTGKRLAEDTGWSGSASSPIADGDSVVFLQIPSHKTGKPPKLVIPPEQTQIYKVRYFFEGGLLQHRLEWTYTHDRNLRCFVSPVIVGEHLYVGGQFNLMLHMKDGEVLFRNGKSIHADRRGNWQATKANGHLLPFGIGGLNRYPSLFATKSNIYVPTERGHVRVVTAGLKPSHAGTNLVPNTDGREFMVGTPAVLDNEIYLRTDRVLYCIAETGSP